MIKMPGFIARRVLATTLSVGVVGAAFVPQSVTSCGPPPIIRTITYHVTNTLPGFVNGFSVLIPQSARTVRVVVRESAGGKIAEHDELWACDLAQRWDEIRPAGDVVMYVIDKRWLANDNTRAAYIIKCLSNGMGPAWDTVPIIKQVIVNGTARVINNYAPSLQTKILTYITSGPDTYGRVLGRLQNGRPVYSHWSASYITGMRYF